MHKIYENSEYFRKEGLKICYKTEHSGPKKVTNVSGVFIV